MANVCLSLGGSDVFVTSSVRSDILDNFFSAHFKFEKLPTCISRLPFALNKTLNLSNTLMAFTREGSSFIFYCMRL